MPMDIFYLRTSGGLYTVEPNFQMSQAMPGSVVDLAGSPKRIGGCEGFGIFVV